MSEKEHALSLGRKIFFLHPSALVQNQIITELAQEEFEVYTAKDESKLRQVLKKYPDSLVFASISEKLKEAAWEEWIKGIMADSELVDVDIGVIAASENAALRRTYEAQHKVQCGYIALRADLPAVMKQLVDILNAANAKGRRKYIRVVAGKEMKITVNFPINGTFVHGIIKDISTAGFSCTFAEDPKIVKNSHFNDIQIRLQTQLLKAEGIVFGSRMDEAEKVYVILFTQRTSPDVRTKIRKFIQSVLQSRMDSEYK